jgi:hypothetical protein
METLLLASSLDEASIQRSALSLSLFSSAREKDEEYICTSFLERTRGN